MINLEEMVCPCCHRRCNLAYPMCHRGRNYRDQLLQDDEIANAPRCPGCHMQCSLADPQCIRGAGFRVKWQEGEEIPERRMPGPRGPQGSKPNRPQRPAGMDDDSRLALLLSRMIPMVLKRCEGGLESKIFEAIQGHDGAASFATILERTRADEDEAYVVLAQALDKGLAQDELMEWGTRFYWLTEDGKRALDQAHAAKREAYGSLFSCYTPEEQEQLETLLERLL